MCEINPSENSLISVFFNWPTFYQSLLSDCLSFIQHITVKMPSLISRVFAFLLLASVLVSSASLSNKDPCEFTCGDGKCISAFWQCDNVKDCSDGLVSPRYLSTRFIIDLILGRRRMQLLTSMRKRRVHVQEPGMRQS